jgi:hypothetical protein
MKRDLAIDHVLLTAAHPAHIRSNPIPERAKARSIPHKMSDPGAPQLVLGGHAGDGWTRAADPTSLDDGNTLAGSGQMPGKQFSALATAENDGVENFGLRHGYFS